MNLSFLGQKWLGNIIGKLSRWGWGDLILDLFLWRFISLFVLFWPSLTKLEGIFSSSVLTFCTQPSFWMLLLSWFSQNLPLVFAANRTGKISLPFIFEVCCLLFHLTLILGQNSWVFRGRRCGGCEFQWDVEWEWGEGSEDGWGGTGGVAVFGRNGPNTVEEGVRKRWVLWFRGHLSGRRHGEDKYFCDAGGNVSRSVKGWEDRVLSPFSWWF